MKRTLALLLLLCPLTAVAQTTWYVRADGGTRYSAARAAGGGYTNTGAPLSGQCDGQADAPYPGSGVNQHCAFNDYRFLYDDQTYQNGTNNSGWVIAGGDTVIMRGGPWRVGVDSGSTDLRTWCFGGSGAINCVNPTLPSGPDAAHPTRILGENYATCGTGIETYSGNPTADRTKVTQLFGGFGLADVLNLRGTHNFDVECLELTRHSSCTTSGILPTGLVNAVAINAGGAGYAVSDVVTINESGGAAGAYLRVSSIGTGGAVTGLTSIAGRQGSNYTVGTGYETSSSSGSGTGLLVNITAVGATVKPSGYPVSCDLTHEDTAADGIHTSLTTYSGQLKNLYIHGLTNSGIQGPLGPSVATANSDILATNVDIEYNESGGWNFDDGTGSPTPFAGVTGVNLAINWSGCFQEYPVVHTHSATACYTQSNQGYGDGVGSATPSTLNWHMDHASAFYNMQDAWDIGHTYHSNVYFNHSIGYGNLGGIYKSGPNLSYTVINSVAISGCQRATTPFPDSNAGYNLGIGDTCRADNFLSFNMLGVGTPVDGNTHIADPFPETPSVAVVENNTIVGYGGDMADVFCFQWNGATMDPSSCTGSQQYSLTFRNNLLLGYSLPGYNGLPGFNLGQGPYLFYAMKPTVTDHNLIWGLRPGYPLAGTFGSTDVLADPLLVSEPANPMVSETALDGLNLALSSASPARNAGVAIAGIGSDFLGNSYASTPSIGAVEYGGTPYVPPVTGNINMELDTDWKTCGNCGNTGGASGQAHGTYTQTPGSPATWSVTPAACVVGVSCDNFYFYRQLATPGTAYNRLNNTLDVMFPTSGDISASQAWESEVHQNYGGKIADCAIQARAAGTGAGFFFYWNYGTSAWIATTVAIPSYVAGAYNTVAYQCTRNANDTLTYDSITVNGTAHALGITIGTTPKVETGPATYINTGFQMDANSSATPYTMKTQNMTATLSTYIPPVTVSSVALASPNPISLTVPATVTPTCTVTYSDSTTKSCTVAGASFSSSDSSKASVSSGGLVTAVAAGSGTITASLSGVSGTDAFTVTASAPTLASVSIALSSASILVGGTSTVTCTANFSDGSHPTFTGTRTSGTTGVAALSGSTLTGVSAGTSVITCSQGGQNATATLTVTAPAAPTLSSIAITLSSTSIIIGGTSSVTCTTTWSDGTHPACAGSLSSSTTSVATVSGLIATGVAAGTSTIRYTQAGVQSNALTLTVATSPPPASSPLNGNGLVGGNGVIGLALLWMRYPGQGNVSLPAGAAVRVGSGRSWIGGTVPKSGLVTVKSGQEVDVMVVGGAN